MTNKDLISELSEEQIDQLLKYAPAYSEQNLANIKAQAFEKLNHKDKPVVKKTIFKRFSVAAAVAVIATVTLLSAVAVAAGPAIVERISRNRLIIVVQPTHEIEDVQRGISFSLELISRDYEAQGHHVSLEDAAKIAAEAIYEEFDFCLDGMVGYITFLGDKWSGFIVSEELTRHAMNVELFHFLIDAVTGEVLVLSMNTPETPFTG